MPTLRKSKPKIINVRLYNVDLIQEIIFDFDDNTHYSMHIYSDDNIELIGSRLINTGKSMFRRDAEIKTPT